MSRYYLSITTWRNWCPGAIHYYGRITSNFKPIIPKPKIGLDFDREEYDVLNLVDDWTGLRGQFDSKQEVITAAIKTFYHLKLKGLLCVGSAGTAQPLRILLAPKSVLQKAKQENKLWHRMEEIYARGGWEKHEKEMQIICDQWEKLWK